VDACKDVLIGFVTPNWGKFKALAGVGPALRIAALSARGMDYDLCGSTVLQHVFGTAVSTPEARKLLKCNVCSDLKVRRVDGGIDLSALSNLQTYMNHTNELTLFSMVHDHDSPFDAYLLVPLHTGRWIMFCIHSRHTEGEEDTLIFTKDVLPQINHLRNRDQKMKFDFPDGVDGCVLITRRPR
jgi:hypothetical protein